MQNKLIATSILGLASKPELNQEIDQLLVAGTDWIHYDIMDGKFVDNATPFNESITTLIEKSKKHYIDFHLMVDDPEKYILKYKDIATSITFHHEAVSYKEANYIIKEYKSQNLKIGIAISPKTNVEQIYEFLPFIDMILVMSVIPGKGGQIFMKESLLKVEKIRRYIDRNGLKTLIQIDGGIKKENIGDVFFAGVDVAVCGSYITNNDYKTQINQLKKS